MICPWAYSILACFTGSPSLFFRLLKWFWDFVYSLRVDWYSLGREALNLMPLGNSLMCCLKIVIQFWFIKVHTKWCDFLSGIFLLVSMMVLGVAKA